MSSIPARCPMCGAELPAGADRCATCPRDEDPAQHDIALPNATQAARRIRRAGNGLLLAALLNLGTWGLPLLLGPLLVHLHLHGNADLDWLRDITMASAIAVFFQLPFVVAGARAARQLREVNKVRVAAWMVMLPLSPAVLVGLPVGVYVLRLLGDPDVIEEFLKTDKKALAEVIYQEEATRRPRLSESPWHALGWIIRNAWQRLLILLGGLTCGLLSAGGWLVTTVPVVWRIDMNAPLQQVSDVPFRLMTAIAGLLLAVITIATFKEKHLPSRGVATLMVGTVAVLAPVIFLLSLRPELRMPANSLPYVTACLGAGLGWLGILELRQGVRSGSYF